MAPSFYTPPKTNQFYAPQVTPPPAAGSAPGPGQPGYASGGSVASNVGHAKDDPNFVRGPTQYYAPNQAPKLPGQTSSVPSDQPGLLSDAGYGEDFYKSHGNDLMTPGASEQLFSEGMAGTNPFYDEATRLATKQINDEGAALGHFNSGATIQADANAAANLRGQQALGLTNLASQADNNKLSRYALTNTEAHGAQDAFEGRVRGALQDTEGLGSAEAGKVSDFYKTGGDENMRAQLDAIEAQYKAGTIDAATREKMLNDLTNLGGKVGGAILGS